MLKRIIKRLIFELEEILNKYRFWKKINKKEAPVFIYQMGKVDSTSIYKSLINYYEGLVLHAHTFTPNHHKLDVRLLYQWLKRKKNLKIISLVREPVSRNISEFFQSYELLTKEPYIPKQYNIEKLTKQFLIFQFHDMPLVWFDDNIKKNFDINVYDYPFSKDGFVKIKQKNIDLLIIRYDLEDEKKEELIKAFLKMETFKITRSNVSSQKIYAEDYKNLLKSIKLPKFILDKIEKSQYFNHFYSQEEICSNIKRWK